MRWRTAPIAEEKRIIKRFLLFPTSINNQTRWLEFANIEQEVEVSWCEIGFIYITSWENIRWID
jgi:hypothetical protein